LITSKFTLATAEDICTQLDVVDAGNGFVTLTIRHDRDENFWEATVNIDELKLALRKLTTK